MTKHLLFYVYPITGSCWPWHFDQLEQYADIFDGRRMLVIAHDEKSDPPKDVRARAEFLKAECYEVVNDPVLCEVRPFHHYLTHFQKENPDDLLFYAHGKGVRHTYSLKNVLAWTECMYRVNLGSAPLIDRLATEHDAIGAFRHRGSHGGGQWHYSGAFFWLRHKALFGAAWKEPYADRYGVEGFPGRVVPFERSVALTPEEDPGNLYEVELPSHLSREWLDRAKTVHGVR